MAARSALHRLTGELHESAIPIESGGVVAYPLGSSGGSAQVVPRIVPIHLRLFYPGQSRQHRRSFGRGPLIQTDVPQYLREPSARVQRSVERGFSPESFNAERSSVTKSVRRIRLQSAFTPRRRL